MAVHEQSTTLRSLAAGTTYTRLQAAKPKMNMSDISNPDPTWLDKGDNAWQMTAASLVALQSLPGLAVLYAGLVSRRWVINSMMMVSRPIRV